MTKRLSVARLIALLILGFALSLISNTLEPAVMARKVLELMPGRRNTAVGLTTFGGLIVATLTQPIVGVLSDRTRSRWGRRLPYLAAGTGLAILCLYLIAFAPAFGLVVVGVLCLQLGSNTIQGPWQALIPDQVPQEQRGQASGIKAMLDILAFVVGRLVAGQLMAHYDEWGLGAILATVSVPVVMLIIALLVTAGVARDPLPAEQPTSQTMRQALAHTFVVDWRAHPAFGWWFMNRMAFWAAFIALNTFLLFYLMDVVGLSERHAHRFVGQLSLALGAALMLISIPSGWLTDRLGRKPVLIAASVVAGGGTLVLLVARTLPWLTVAGVIIGLGIGTFLSANWALLTDIVPAAEAAHYLGVANIATAGGSALARLLGGALIDSLNSAFGKTTGYLLMYALAAALFFFSALAALPLPLDKPKLLAR